MRIPALASYLEAEIVSQENRMLSWLLFDHLVSATIWPWWWGDAAAHGRARMIQSRSQHPGAVCPDAAVRRSARAHPRHRSPPADPRLDDRGRRRLELLPVLGAASPRALRARLPDRRDLHEPDRDRAGANDIRFRGGSACRRAARALDHRLRRDFDRSSDRRLGHGFKS